MACVDAALVGRERDVARAFHARCAQQLQAGVAGDPGLCVGRAVDGEGGLVPQPHLAVGLDAGAGARTVVARAQQNGALVGQQQRTAVDHRAVVTRPRADGLAPRRTGQAIGVGRGARVQVHLGTAAHADVTQVADHRGPRADVDRGAAIGDEAGLGQCHGHQATRVELGLVVAHHLVQRIHREAAIPRGGHGHVHLCTSTQPGQRVDGDGAARAARRAIERTTRTGLDVPAHGVGIGRRILRHRAAAQPQLEHPVVGVHVDVLGVDTRAVGQGGLHRAVHGVLRRGAAGAVHGGRNAVDFAVEARGVVGQQREVVGVERMGGVATAHLSARVAAAAGAGAGRRTRQIAAAARLRLGVVDVPTGGRHRDAVAVAGRARHLHAVAHTGQGRRVRLGVGHGGTGRQEAQRQARNIGGLFAVVLRPHGQRARYGEAAAMAHRGRRLARIGGVGCGGVDACQQAARRSRALGQRRKTGQRGQGFDAHITCAQVGVGAQAGADLGRAVHGGHGRTNAHATGHVHAHGVGLAGRAGGGIQLHQAIDVDAAALTHAGSHHRRGLGRGHRTAGGQPQPGFAGQRLRLGFGHRVGMHLQAVQGRGAVECGPSLQTRTHVGHRRATHFGHRHRGAGGHRARDADAAGHGLRLALVTGRDFHRAGAAAGRADQGHAISQTGIGAAAVGDDGCGGIHRHHARQHTGIGVDLAQVVAARGHRSQPATAQRGLRGHLRLRALLQREHAHAGSQPQAATRSSTGVHAHVTGLAGVDVHGAASGQGGLAHTGAGARGVGTGQVARNRHPTTRGLAAGAGVADARVAGLRQQALDAAVAGLAVGVAVDVGLLAARRLQALA